MTIEIPTWVDGVLTPVEKLEAHRRGLRHKAVSVFVRRGDEILLQRRALGKYHTPGLWANTCCTHPDWGEGSAHCATRRLREELGITGQTPLFRQQVEYRADVGDGLIEHEVVDIFLVEATRDMPLAPNPDEVMEVAWRDLESLRAQVRAHPERYTPWLRIYLADHAAAIFDPVTALRAPGSSGHGFR
jgi:isopentenyl-diphosphate delta-isomerase